MMKAALLLLMHEMICVAGMRTVPVPVRQNISFKEFHDDFLRTSTPVVIRGSMSAWPAVSKWNHEYLAARCGQEPLTRACDEHDNQVKVFNRSLTGDSWGALQKVNLTENKLSTVADLVAAQTAGDGSNLYLHDQCIDILCPGLFEDIRNPKYFPVDYLQQMPVGFRNTHGCHTSKIGRPGHPSLFVGPGGSQSGLHADTSATRFWMAVIKGTKQFRLFNQSNVGTSGDHTAEAKGMDALYPTEEPDVVIPKRGYFSFFEVDSFHPNFTKHPKLTKAVAWEANVTAGDIIFIPQTWPHQVRNLDLTFAISYNFVDQYNYHDHLDYLSGQLDSVDEDTRTEAVDQVAAYSNGKWFPLYSYSQVPRNRADDTWAQFFERQQPENRALFDLQKYTAEVAAKDKKFEQSARKDVAEELAEGNLGTSNSTEDAEDPIDDDDEGLAEPQNLPADSGGSGDEL